MLSRELLRSRGRDTPRLGPTNRRPPRFHVGTFGLKSREINRKITKKKKNRKLSKAVRNYIIIAVSVLAFRDTRNHFLRHFFFTKKIRVRSNIFSCYKRDRFFTPIRSIYTRHELLRQSLAYILSSIIITSETTRSLQSDLIIDRRRNFRTREKYLKYRIIIIDS